MKTIVNILMQFSCEKEPGIIYSYQDYEDDTIGCIQVLLLPHEILENSTIDLLVQNIKKYHINACDILLMNDDPNAHDKIPKILKGIETCNMIDTLQIKPISHIDLPITKLNDLLYQEILYENNENERKFSLHFENNYQSLKLFYLPVNIASLSTLKVKDLSLPVEDMATLEQLIKNDTLEILEMKLNIDNMTTLTTCNKNVYDISVQTEKNLTECKYMLDWFTNLDYFTLIKV